MAATLVDEQTNEHRPFETGGDAVAHVWQQSLALDASFMVDNNSLGAPFMRIGWRKGDEVRSFRVYSPLPDDYWKHVAIGRRHGVDLSQGFPVLNAP